MDSENGVLVPEVVPAVKVDRRAEALKHAREVQRMKQEERRRRGENPFRKSATEERLAVAKIPEAIRKREISIQHRALEKLERELPDVLEEMRNLLRSAGPDDTNRVKMAELYAKMIFPYLRAGSAGGKTNSSPVAPVVFKFSNVNRG